MKITKEETSQLDVVLNIELDSEDIEPYLERSLKRIRGRVDIPGFRRGKAPRYLMENYVGRDALIRESLDYIVQESTDKAITEENLTIFGEPDVELVKIEPFSFKATVPQEPVVDLGNFRDLRLEPEPVEVTEEQVKEVLERIRYDAAPWEPVDGPVKFGNLVALDVDGTVDGRSVADDRGVDFTPTQENPYPFPGFSIHLEGMKGEESKEFTIQIPEDFGDETLAGKECRFNVKVLTIKEKVLPELDDELAKGVGEGYESLEALRAKVLQDLTDQRGRAARHAFQENSLEEVIKGASVEVSDLTIDREIDHLLEDEAQAAQGRNADIETYLSNVGKSREEIREELRPRAQERLTRFLVLRSLAQTEDIEVGPGEIDGEVENLTSGSGESGESLRKAFSSESARSSLANAILTRKVLERLGEIVQGEAGKEETSQEKAQDTPLEEGTDEPQEAQSKGGGTSDD